MVKYGYLLYEFTVNISTFERHFLRRFQCTDWTKDEEIFSPSGGHIPPNPPFSCLGGLGPNPPNQNPGYAPDDYDEDDVAGDKRGWYQENSRSVQGKVRPIGRGIILEIHKFQKL